MKVLITGGLGYIGCVLTNLLLARGYDVTVYDNQYFSQHVLARFCSWKTFDVVIGDIRDQVKLDPLLRTNDIIINLAALVGAPLCAAKTFEVYEVNTAPVKNIVSKTSPNQIVLIPTTNSGYGVGELESYCTETSPLKPISDYGKSKVYAEEVLLSTGRGVSLRLATVFGMSERMRKDLLVNDFVYRAVHDRSLIIFEGHFRRNFIHVTDVARAFLHAIERYDVMSGQAYNVGLDEANLTKVELARRVQHHLPDFKFVESPIGEDPDKRDYLVSNQKILATGFVPETSLDSGIEELIKGFKIYRQGGIGNV